MPLRRSEPLTSPAAPAAAGEPPAWWTVIRSNWLVAALLLLLVPLNYLVHDTTLFDNYTRRIVMLIGVSVIGAVSLQLINGTSGQFSLGHAGFMAIGAYLAAYPMKAYANNGANPLGVLLFYVALALVVCIAGVALFGLFRLVRRSGRVHAQLPTLLLLILAAWFLWDVSAAARVPEGAGQPAYLVWSRAIGLLQKLYNAVANRNLSLAMDRGVGAPLCFLIVILGGGACASVAGLVIGLPTLRLRGDYLAIATLGFAEIIRVSINNSEPLGGARGLMISARYTTFAWLYAFVIITTVVIWRIANSATGRTLVALREDEIAAGAVGIDKTRYRVFAFVVGSFFAGVGGALFAHMSYLLHPNEFGFLRSVELVVMVTLGGLGSISGAIVTAAVLTLLPELLRGFAEWRMIAYSLLLIGMMLLRPQGITGGRELSDFFSRRRRAHGKRGFAPVLPAPTTGAGGPDAPA